MLCSVCALTAPEGDLFCEQCGQRFVAKPVVEGGCSCGADATEIDEEGFCGVCGRRVRRPAEDHIEEALSGSFAAVSDRGLRHQTNEDRFTLVESGAARLIVVCDGVSSTRDANTAAEIAAQTIAGHVRARLEPRSGPESGDAGSPCPPKTSGSELLLAGIAAAGAALRGKAAMEGSAEGAEPSTTVVAALLQERQLSVAWMGDSRAYWMDKGGLQQLTQDDSWLREVLQAKQMPEDEALLAPQAHAITRWIGADADPEWAAQFVELEWSDPGLLLLCTDGLWNYLPDLLCFQQTLQALDQETTEALPLARDLVAFANRSGGRDNTTVAVLRLGDAAQVAGTSSSEAVS